MSSADWNGFGAWTKQPGRNFEKKYPVKYSISYPAGPRCTPLIDDGLVYTLGAEGHLYCFDAEQGYSPPTIIEAGGVRQLILAKPDSVSSVNPDDGTEYWSVPCEATSGAIIMSPVKMDHWLYIRNDDEIICLDLAKPQ